MQVLVGHVTYPSGSSYYHDWLDGLKEPGACAATFANLFTASGRRAFIATLQRTDAVVLLHSCLADSLDYVRPVTSALKHRRVKLAGFVGNEYNNPWAPLSEKIAWLKEVQADWVVTQLLEESGRWLYEPTGARVLSLPHALNPRAFPRGPDTTRRTLNIGTRSYAYPLFLGDNLRHRLFERVRAEALKRDWKIDISTTRRFDRRHWAAFLRDCQCTLATEAGAPVVSRSDDLVFEIQQFLNSRRTGVYRPNSRLRGLTRRIPWPVKEAVYRLLARMGIKHEALEYDDALFNELRERFFDNRMQSGVSGKCVSARHFDAAGSGTAQILARGQYNGIFHAGEHYLAVDSDLGNVDTVLDQAADPAIRTRVAEAAFCLVHDHHTIAHRLSRLTEALA